ncbi:phosphoglycerate mutase [Thermomonas sp. HDW16]|uniref:phosphoglycerate mutase n=1 Tax=Thermomonas sp. HDW16 TaxID=2714945 RepID=UPI001409BB6D|nr:phosphoglycerate mutase [Thermomonas sp. HDW16]QIL20659.1 phosphoglycerate mutase [Thermomonas sp. HDW16]
MARLTLLLPSTAKSAGLPLPADLAKALGKADRAAHDAGRQAQLSRHFRLLPNRWSDAALTRVVDTDEGDARLNAWLRADPAYIRPDINGARLLGIGDALGIEQADVDAFLPALRSLFGDAGFILDAPTPSRWYLRLPREAKLPAFTSPDDALGDDVFEHIPDAPEARRWRVLSSEAQVTLHNHPRNAERIAAGKPPINSLWFWGGGLLPDSIASDRPTLYSDDVLLHGIARIGKLDAMPLAACTNTEIDDALVDLRDARDARATVERWLSPAASSAARRDVVLDFADGQVFTLRANQRWRFWRKPQAFQS